MTNLIVIIILIIIVFFAVRCIIRKKKSGAPCMCCSGCKECSGDCDEGHEDKGKE